MDIFDYMTHEEKEKNLPLAARMRPDTLEEYVGQKHIIGKDKLLYRAIKADQLGSIILYGPPGVGKTTLARVIANTTSADFRQVNATTAGKKDMENVIHGAIHSFSMTQRRTILFIDEIHRFNKAQQDYLLPYVEDGTVILIGATTENPYFEVNSALISRSRIFELKPLDKEDILELLYRAINDREKGEGTKKVILEEDAASFLADMADGDARGALNALELAVLTTERLEDGFIHIDLSVAQQCIQKKVIRYDKTGDNHYDTISAFIKSVRGSDPDAAIYYLARMLEAGEDVKFIARRLIVLASEDIGNAAPLAMTIASSAAASAAMIGMPEARIVLAQATAYLACAPKSNAAIIAIDEAIQKVRETGNLAIPSYLQDAHYKNASKLNRGKGYKYPHSYKNHYVYQQYLPDLIKDEKFYHLTDNGHEAKMKEYLKSLKK
ncbi:replication-associated recombination protein A [Eggerthia catenaformis]|uniref:replication-associated recombination protein A n=1 Tax=Eggerthia catenaformis TaxID=31973 RepID=UPI0028EC9E92|nr:replication-associated recombination protein A [Eggerthia catenaformis]